jgi:hypothetical protein
MKINDLYELLGLLAYYKRKEIDELVTHELDKMIKIIRELIDERIKND